MSQAEIQAEVLFQEWLDQAMQNPGLSRELWAQRASECGDAVSAEFDLLCSRFLNPTELIRPGRALGDFRLVRHLGSGAYGGVWEAVQMTLNRSVALKFLHPVVALSPLAGERLRQEAEAAAQVNHVNVVTVFGIGHEKGLDFLVTELVEGGETLTEFQGDLKQLLRLFHQAVLGLTACLKSGVQHCDLKASNLLLTPDGQLKVGDFGIAHLMDDDIQEELPSVGQMLETLTSSFKDALRKIPNVNKRRRGKAFLALLNEFRQLKNIKEKPDVLLRQAEAALLLRSISYSRVTEPQTLFLGGMTLALTLIFSLAVLFPLPAQNQCLKTDDTLDGFVEILNPTFALGDNYTFEVWVDAGSSHIAVPLMSAGSGGVCMPWYHHTNSDVDSSGVPHGGIASANNYACSGSHYFYSKDNERTTWRHYAISSSNGVHTHYVNGIYAGTSPVMNTPNANQDFFFGLLVEPHLATILRINGGLVTMN